MSTLEFEVRSGGTIRIDLDKCQSCETKACVKICNTTGMGQILELKDGVPALKPTLEEVKRGAWGPHISRVELVQLGQFDALRVELAPGEEHPLQIWLMVTPGGQAVGFIPKSDLAAALALMGTLRAAER